ncbi:DUF4303 domain-containing protein [uncultured Clostridium sp.]|uniref:DUF4303 domain-containing protein n=1 Tax=uncultured Clostridium sp. TaxID=59620 RepID=UPI0025EB19CB|nr:DUF4303 domain-containing protein [uncultured Clostridium sp.]
MKEKEQIKKYKEYIKEYKNEKKIISKSKIIIRDYLEEFKGKLKAAIKVALEDSIDDYGNEGIYMFTLAYLYQYDNSYFWSVISTEDKYKELIKDKESNLMYYRYSPEESPNWEAGCIAFDEMNNAFVEMVEKQEFDEERCDEDDKFWDSFEFDNFYNELEEVCLQSLNEIREEGFLEKIKLENIIFQFYVREHYPMEKDIEMFRNINKGKDKAIEEFIKSFE